MSEDTAVVEPVAEAVSESVTATPAAIPPNPPVNSAEGSASEELLQKKLGFANSKLPKLRRKRNRQRSNSQNFNPKLHSCRKLNKRRSVKTLKVKVHTKNCMKRRKSDLKRLKPVFSMKLLRCKLNWNQNANQLMPNV